MARIEMFFDHTCPYCLRGYQYLKPMLPGFPHVEIIYCPIEAHPRVEEPEHKPYEDLAVQGALYFAHHGLDELAYHERIFRACFTDHLKVDDIATLTACAKELGADEADFRKALEERIYEDELQAANTYAYDDNKVWAVPTFVCGEKRLDAAEGLGITEKDLFAFLASCASEK